jgi:hypothetical protein
MVRHLDLILGGLILLGMFLVYGFIAKHQRHIHHDSAWTDTFKKFGVDPSGITHDEDTWYYNGKTTCVAYGPSSLGQDPGGKGPDGCNQSESFCSGGFGKYGSMEEQAKAVADAIHGTGLHSGCPIIYF